MEGFRIPRETVEAMRRAVTIPPETLEAIRRATDVRIPPETLEALRRATDVRIPRETLEAFRKMSDVRIPRETLEAFRKMSDVRIPRETLEAFRKMSDVRIPRETLEAMRRAVTIPPETLEATRRLAAQIQMPDLTASVREALAEAARRFRAAWEEAMPHNWADLEIGEVMDAIERVRLTGYMLVWIPRVEVVREVLAAGPSQTASVLLARRDDVLYDAMTCLGEVGDPDLGFIRTAVEEAVETFRDGRPLAAQALASVAFTSEIHEFFAMGTTASRRRMEERDPNDVPLGQLRLRTIFLAGARALAEFRPDTARPVRYDFNRHNSAHRLTPKQWSEANALSGIMLATSFLREMQYWSEIERDS